MNSDRDENQSNQDETPEWERWLSEKPDWGFWSVNRDGTIYPAVVPMAFEDMDMEKAREVRDELSEAIEWSENNV